MTKPKQLGFWMCLALVIGNMVGSGVFMLPASLAPYGLNSVLGWLLTAAGSLLLALVFSGLSRAFPEQPGPYAFTRMAFGDLTGFVVAWGYWVSVWVGNAAVATGAISYLSALFPWMRTVPGAPALVTLFFVWLFTALNIRGTREVGVLQILTTVIKLLPLLLVAGLGLVLWARSDSRLDLTAMHNHRFNLDAVAASATLTLWAFLGLESASVASDKVIDPQRTIPRATLWGTVITAVIYVASCSLVLLLIPSAQLAQSNAPFAEVIALFFGQSAGHWLALFAAISGLGALSGWILVQGEMPYQMAKAGIFPSAFGQLSARGTPRFGLLVSGVLLSAVVLSNYGPDLLQWFHPEAAHTVGKSMVEVFTFLLLIATSATLVMYLLCSLAALRLMALRRLTLARHQAAFVAVAACAAVYALWALYGAGQEALLWGFFLLSLALPIFYFRQGRFLALLACLPLVLVVPVLHVAQTFTP